MSNEVLNINESEMRKKIEIIDELIKKCKSTKAIVDGHAKAMRTSIKNISARGSISSTKIDELINLLNELKKELQEILNAAMEYKKDEVSTVDYDKVLREMGINPNGYVTNPAGINDNSQPLIKPATLASQVIPMVLGDKNSVSQPTPPEKLKYPLPATEKKQTPSNKKKKKKTSDGGSPSYNPTPKTTPKTTPSTEQPTERPTEIITQPTTPPTTAPTTPATQPSNNNGDNNYSGDNSYNGGNDYSDYSNESSVEIPASEAPTTPKFDEDIIKEGNSYKLPTSTKPVAPTTTTTSSKGNGVIPVLAGLSAAAAAGIGAKAYMDRKNNRDNDEEEEEFKAEDWSENTDVNMEYQEPEGEKVESLDFDDGVEENYEDTTEPERYGARTQQDLQDLQ